LAGLADAIAGLVVAGVVAMSSVTLAREAIDALVDRSPEDLAHRMAEAVARLPGVIEVRRMRLRRVGARYFADVVAVAPRTTNLAESHALSEEIERAIQAVEPRTDVVVHLEPGVSEEETVVDRANLVARELGVQVHDVGIHRVRGRLEVDLHVEVDPSLSLERAHDVASELERRLVTAEPRVREVNTHVESAQPQVTRRIDVTAHEPSVVQGIVAVADRVVGPARCHQVRLYRSAARSGEPVQDSHRDVVLDCEFPPTLPVTEAHLEAERLERALRDAFPQLAEVLVHVEPAEGNTAHG
jgi:divalent metal cation (Fe/Co/Zn/Cd) transporter